MSEPTNYNSVKTAHATLGIVAWTVFFPFGSVLMRALSGPRTWLIHGLMQLFSYACFTAAVGMGIWMTQNSSNSVGSYHPVIGLVIFALVTFQPLGGLLHHLLYRKGNRQAFIAQTHVWLGRILITLGIINGGLGLNFSADANRAEYIAYGVIAGVIWASYMVYSIMWRGWAEKDRPALGKRFDSGGGSSEEKVARV